MHKKRAILDAVYNTLHRRNNVMDENKAFDQLELLEQYVFELMVDNQVDLFEAGFYDDIDVAPEEFQSTEEQEALLLVMEAYERIMYKILELREKPNDPQEMYGLQLITSTMAAMALGIPDEAAFEDEEEQHLKLYAEAYKKKREKKEAFRREFNERMTQAAYEDSPDEQRP